MSEHSHKRHASFPCRSRDPIGNLKSIQYGTTSSTARILHAARPPLEASTAPSTLTGRCTRQGPRRPPPIAHALPARARAHAAPRRTLSFTIASQTIASSPDGSVISSAARFTPVAAVGGGWRFRASSTVTSSSSPCNDTSGHLRTRPRASRRQGPRCQQSRAHYALSRM